MSDIFVVKLNTAVTLNFGKNNAKRTRDSPLTLIKLNFPVTFPGPDRYLRLNRRIYVSPLSIFEKIHQKTLQNRHFA